MFEFESCYISMFHVCYVLVQCSFLFFDDYFHCFQPSQSMIAKNLRTVKDCRNQPYCKHSHIYFSYHHNNGNTLTLDLSSDVCRAVHSPIIQTNKETNKYAELLPSFPLQCQFHPKITSWTKCSWRALSNRNSHVSIHAQLSLTTIHLMYTFTTDLIIITTNNHLSIYFFNPTSLVLLHLVSDQSLSVERAQIICLYIRNLSHWWPTEAQSVVPEHWALMYHRGLREDREESPQWCLNISTRG